eukprot:12804779-Alexandrium_andersonii.AAC.1
MQLRSERGRRPLLAVARQTAARGQTARSEGRPHALVVARGQTGRSDGRRGALVVAHGQTARSPRGPRHDAENTCS